MGLGGLKSNSSEPMEEIGPGKCYRCSEGIHKNALKNQLEIDGKFPGSSIPAHQASPCSYYGDLLDVHYMPETKNNPP